MAILPPTPGHHCTIFFLMHKLVFLLTFSSFVPPAFEPALVILIAWLLEGNAVHCSQVVFWMSF